MLIKLSWRRYCYNYTKQKCWSSSYCPQRSFDVLCLCRWKTRNQNSNCHPHQEDRHLSWSFSSSFRRWTIPAPHSSVVPLLIKYCCLKLQNLTRTKRFGGMLCIKSGWLYLIRNCCSPKWEPCGTPKQQDTFAQFDNRGFSKVIKKIWLLEKKSFWAKKILDDVDNTTS